MSNGELSGEILHAPARARRHDRATSRAAAQRHNRLDMNQLHATILAVYSRQNRPLLHKHLIPMVRRARAPIVDSSQGIRGRSATLAEYGYIHEAGLASATADGQLEQQWEISRPVDRNMWRVAWLRQRNENLREDLERIPLEIAGNEATITALTGEEL